MYFMFLVLIGLRCWFLPLKILSCEESPQQSCWECGSSAHWAYLWMDRWELKGQQANKQIIFLPCLIISNETFWLLKKKRKEAVLKSTTAVLFYLTSLCIKINPGGNPGFSGTHATLAAVSQVQIWIGTYITFYSPLSLYTRSSALSTVLTTAKYIP